MKNIIQEFKGLIWVALTLLILAAIQKQGATQTRTQAWKDQSAREHWSFDINLDREHSKGLKKKSGILFPEGRPVLTQILIPNSLDLHPTLTPIKDQGQCGSCWAFSLTATERDSWKVKHGADPGDLSQQYLVDWAKNANGCQGGFFDAANYLIHPKGSPLLSQYPYTAVQGRPQKSTPAASISSWHMLGGQSGPSVRDVESYLVQTKMPVSTVVAAGTGPWEYYKSGVYNACTVGQVDHMINIVGFDNEGATFDSNGNLPPGKGIWILRNSWGTSWGEQGWMRTKMTDPKGNRCNNVGELVAYLTP